jgi:EAL domain-containing protein (putative c-di-GMP-specific phosphodiesterase class I)
MEQFSPFDPFKLLEAPATTESLVAASRVEANARLRFRVAQALAQGRIEFHFQPIVRARNPDVPAFFEMLARLRLPDGHLLAAGAFMPAIEAGALGRAIDRLALSEALRALAADPALRLSVNMSPLSMGDEGWLAMIAAAARGGSGVCGRLILEITENAAMADAAQTIDFMDHVRATGCAFALDDFGAGATGFRHFRDFRFDMVKIDGAFIRGVHAAPDAQVLVECLAGVARHFEMMTVAEQVENEADAAWLRQVGVDCLQGYLYGRPAARPVLSHAAAENDAARRLAG